MLPALDGCRDRLWRSAAALALLVGACISAPAHADTYFVSNTNDSGAGSLRQAILDANTHAGADTILFSIGSGAQTITPLSALPVSTGPVTFDAWQQMGFTGTPLIRIDGINAGGAGTNGLRLDAGPSTVQGLIITRFGGNGLVINGGSGNVVKGCYLGTDGTTALGNGYAGLSVGGANYSTVGGTLAKDRNVISGNGQNGVMVGAGASNITFYGNYIGTNAAGSAALANGGYGMRLFGSSTVIGNALSNTRNIISGNASSGISIESGVASTQILGAYIGLNADGTAAIGNGADGITDGGSESLIGDVTPGGGNVISGNTQNGITLFGADGSQIVNNLIGTNPAGTASIPNLQYGIRGYSGGFINIGTSAVGAGNLISGNANNGVTVESGASNYFVVGNKIGTNLAGTAALPNVGGGVVVSGSGVSLGNASAGNLISGNALNGIAISDPAQDVSVLNNIIGLDATGSAKVANGGYGVRAIAGGGIVIGQAGDGNVISGNARGVILEAVDGAVVQGNTIGLSSAQDKVLANNEVGVEILGANNQIGGTAAGAGNVIAGNTSYGVFLYGPGATGNHVEGNIIGGNAALSGNFGNSYGVVIYGASGNFVGGTAAGAGNVIANSPNMGIYDWFGSQNSFLGNRIYGNGALGIDLEPQGPIPNDALDADHGPNEGQNYPIVTLATSTASDVTIEGQLSSAPDTSYRIEYFVSVICPSSGLGVGENFIGFQNVMTDANGIAALGTTIPTALIEGYVTATATSADGNTSEFSPCIAIGPASAGQFNISRDPVLAYEDFQVAHVAVVRSQGLTGAVSVHFKTADGTATSPSDYGAVDQVLNFADGEAIKLVDIPIVLDDIAEGEHFGISLSQATGGAFLGPQAAVDVTVIDHDPLYPVYTVGDATVAEPLSGQAQVNVAVKLSAPTSHTVTLSYFTQDGSAKAGQDYVTTTGPLVFAIGETTKLVPVTILANGFSPSDRVFNLLITGNGAQQVIAGDSEGEIVILGGDHIFKNGFD